MAAELPRRKLIYSYYICVVAALCMYMYGYDASTFNTVNTKTTWNDYFGDQDDTSKPGHRKVSDALLGTVNTAYTCGAIITGFFLSSIFMDKLGRRSAMFTGSLIVIGATMLQTFAPNLAAHVIGRGIVGLGQGLVLPAGPVYIGECAPASIRGKMMSLWQLFYSVGALFSYIVGLFTGYHSELGDWQWRYVIIFQALIPAIFCIVIWTCPETPRWLIYRGRIDEARAVLSKLRPDEEVEAELAMLRQHIEEERVENPGNWAVYKSLFTKRNMVKRLLMAMFINFGQQCTGQSSLNNYSSKIYSKIFTDSNTIDIINTVNAVCGILFTLNSTFFVDRLGRIKIFVLGSIGMGVCCFLVATVVITASSLTTTAIGAGVIFLLFTFTFFYKPTWGATTWIYTGEIFPITVRAQAVAISSQTQNIASLILGQIFPFMFTAWSYGSFYVFMAFNIGMGLIVYFFYPETRGVSLEDMDEIFDGVKPTKVNDVEIGVEASDAKDKE